LNSERRQRVDSRQSRICRIIPSCGAPHRRWLSLPRLSIFDSPNAEGFA
jgi:hypothetical protein